MLILKRKHQQGIHIGSAYIRVLGMDKRTGDVIIGIDAPDNVNVRRGELKPRESDRKGDV